MPEIDLETSDSARDTPALCPAGNTVQANPDLQGSADRPRQAQDAVAGSLSSDDLPLLPVSRPAKPKDVSPFADVYRADYAPLGLVAAKQFKLNGEDESRRQEQVLRSLLRELGALKHDNLLPIIGLCEGAHGDVCVVTAWHDSLATYLTNRKDADRRRLLLDVADGLLHLHRKGYAHGKLHPWNVLVTESGRALLTDYCIADYIPDDGSGSMRATHGMEKVLFVAPEVNTAGGKRCPAADVFAFGMMMCYVLCGDPPPAGATLVSIVTAIGHGWRPSIESLQRDLDAELYSLMGECWDQDSGRRPEMDTVLRRLRQIDDETRPQALEG